MNIKTILAIFRYNVGFCIVVFKTFSIHFLLYKLNVIRFFVCKVKKYCNKVFNSLCVQRTARDLNRCVNRNTNSFTVLVVDFTVILVVKANNFCGVPISFVFIAIVYINECAVRVKSPRFANSCCMNSSQVFGVNNIHSIYLDFFTFYGCLFYLQRPMLYVPVNSPMPRYRKASQQLQKLNLL